VPASKYTEALADRICAEIANGRSLRQICQDDGMPSRETVLNWMHAHEDFFAKCARAREQQADHLFDGMAQIEDRVLAGELDPKAANVVLSSQQWRAAKLRPKVYGQRVDVDVTARQAEVTDEPIDASGWAAQYATNRVATAGGSSEGSD